jgi:hypothetical protein
MKSQNKKIVSKIFKIQLWITCLIFLAYLIVAFGKGDNFFANDFKNKKEVAGSVVSAMIKIFGIPGQPILSGQAHCDDILAYIRLDWPTEEDAITYDVYRNGAVLALDLVDNFYLDGNVQDETSYNYYIIARGPGGQATSQTITVVTQNCNPLINPFVNINVFNGKNIINNDIIIETKNRKPSFGGLTNIENAIIEIEIRGEQIFYTTTNANQNGAWQWLSTINFSKGTYVVYVKAIDPADENIFADYFLSFKIKEDYQDEEDVSERQEIFLASLSKEDRKIYDKQKKPFDFDLSLENNVYIKGVNMSEEAYRGESLQVQLEFAEVSMVNKFIEISYSLMDANRNIVAKYSDKVMIKENMIVNKDILLPYNFELGRYGLKIDATVDEVTVSHEGYFELVDRPILKLGAVGYITYADIVSNLGWLAVFSTLFLGFFSILAIWEHHLYKRGMFHITEGILKRRGFID